MKLKFSPVPSHHAVLFVTTIRLGSHSFPGDAQYWAGFLRFRRKPTTTSKVMFFSFTGQRHHLTRYHSHATQLHTTVDLGNAAKLSEKCLFSLMFLHVYPSLQVFFSLLALTKFQIANILIEKWAESTPIFFSLTSLLRHRQVILRKMNSTYLFSVMLAVRYHINTILKHSEFQG